MKQVLLLATLFFQFQAALRADITGISISNVSACSGASTTCPTDDFFTADLTIFYDAKPATGTLSLSSTDIVGSWPSANVADIGATAHTFVGVNLRADGLAIEMTAAFSDGGSPFFDPNLGTAPVPCSAFPATITVGGFVNCPAETGVYNYNGQLNGAPSWASATDLLFWNGSLWGILYLPGLVLISVSEASSAGQFSCSGWTDAYGCGVPTFDICEVSNVSATALSNIGACLDNSTCTPTDDTFSADATVQFSYAPAAGNLVLRRGATILATKSAAELACSTTWTFQNLSLAADGKPLVLTAQFDNKPAFNSTGLGNALFCSTGEITDLTAADISPCLGQNTSCTTDDFFTADLTVSFSTIPATGSLVLSGADILGASLSVPVANLSGNSYVFQNVQLRLDGQNIDLTATFTAGCFYQNTNLGTAPEPCGVTPTTITVGGLPSCPAETGVYTLTGAHNGAPKWTFAADEIRWNGSAWEVFHLPALAALSINSTGSISNFPCSGWTNQYGCGAPTFDFCGDLGASSIAGIQIGNIGSCQAGADCALDLFTANVTVNFANAPPVGDLVLKRGTTILATKSASELACTSVWAFENVQIPADGQPLLLTATFPGLATFTSASLGAAPAACSVGKIFEVSAANFSACQSQSTTCAGDDAFTADVTVVFSAPPATGSLALSGADILDTPPSVAVANLSGNSCTFTAVKLRADGLAVDLTASFSDGCSMTKNNLATAPTGCSSPPPVIVASGYCFATMNGNYVLAGTANGAPFWANPYFGLNSQRVEWSGTAWQVISNAAAGAVHSGGNAGFFPCGAFTNLNSCGSPTFDFCGTLAVPSVAGISLADVGGCNDNGTPTILADDFFTADATVNFAFAPASGTLTLKRGTTILAIKPAYELACTTAWTFENVQLPADGQPIHLIADFSNYSAFISGSLGTAPSHCSIVDTDMDGHFNTTDCDDANPLIHPAATELASDAIDQNCDGAELCFKDADDDGWRANASFTVFSADTDCLDSGEALASDPIGDCADTDAARFSGNPEICDGKDNDCLNGVPYTEADADNDTYRICAGDCDDANAAKNPGATELVCNQLDDDCDAQIDEGTDAAPPTAVCKPTLTVALFEGAATASAATLNNGSSDACSGTNVSLSIVSGQTSFSCASIEASPFALVLQVSDAAGNTATCQSSVTVADVLSYSETGRRNASDGLLADKLGWGLALDGTTAVAGALEAKVGLQNKQGAAYIFEKDLGGANNWGQAKKIADPEGAVIDYFGNALALDGATLLAGEYGDNVGVKNDQGSAIIFGQNAGGAGNWGAVKKLIASDGAGYEYFGASVALKNSHALVGANKAKVGANAAQGAAYIFQKDLGGADNWGQAKKLTASDGAASHFFGHAVALNPAADLALVGANGNASNRGAAYVFEKNLGGADNWGQAKKLTASDGAASDWFGASASMSADYALIGAPNKAASAGAAYIFGKDFGGADNWGQAKKLTASDGAAGNKFGWSVAISSDYAYVGAPANAGKGAVYVFQKDNGGAGNWGQLGKYTASDGAANDQYGFSVAASGLSLAVGANLDDVSGKADQGSMYVLGGALSCDGMAAPGEERAAQNLENQLDVRCSPNPFSDELSIETAASGPVHLTVTDAAGRAVASVDLPSGAVKFDLRTVGFPPGLYFVRISAGSSARVAPVALVR